MDARRAWAVKVTVLATDAEIDGVTERLGQALCPDPDHAGDCANPWQITSAPVDDLDEPERAVWRDAADDLAEQVRAAADARHAG